MWVRPYLGSGPRLLRQTVGIGSQASGLALSQNSFGFQAFGGSELTFASIPRFTLSADLRYGWVQEAKCPPSLEVWASRCRRTGTSSSGEPAADTCGLAGGGMVTFPALAAEPLVNITATVVAADSCPGVS